MKIIKLLQRGYYNVCNKYVTKMNMLLICYISFNIKLLNFY